MLRALLGVMELEGYCQVLRKRRMGTLGAWVGAPANLDSVLRVPAKKQEGGWRPQGTETPIPLHLSVFIMLVSQRCSRYSEDWGLGDPRRPDPSRFLGADAQNRAEIRHRWKRRRREVVLGGGLVSSRGHKIVLMRRCRSLRDGFLEQRYFCPKRMVFLVGGDTGTPDDTLRGPGCKGGGDSQKQLIHMNTPCNDVWTPSNK